MDTDRLNSSLIDPLFQNWLAELEKRHLAELTFPEVSRALRALSSTYVERRHKIGEGGAFSGAGKRAAFALFYAPLHFLLVHHLVRALPGAMNPAAPVIDLGCGSGAAGAAWAREGPCRIVGLDRHPWALDEAGHTYRAFGLTAQIRQGDAAVFAPPKARASIVAAFTMNELPDAGREALLSRLVDGSRAQGHQVLIVEPLARGVTPWWSRWQDAFERAGGRADEWRFPAQLPPIVAKLDRAAGLRHRELTGRTLWIAGR